MGKIGYFDIVADVELGDVDVQKIGDVDAGSVITADGYVGTDLLKVAGVTPQLDDTDKPAVSLYGKAVAAGDMALLLDSYGRTPIVGLGGFSPGYAKSQALGGFGTEGVLSPRIMITHPFLYNGINMDSYDNNIALTLLASAARTATTPTPDQTNYNHRGLALFINVTARVGTTTLTPSLQVKDPVGAEYHTVWTAAAAINTADGLAVYLFYPSALADAAELYTEAVDLTVPRTWRVNVVHGDTDSITYSVAAGMIL